VFPSWLKGVAIRVDELVANDGVRARFRSQLRVWAEEVEEQRGEALRLLSVRNMATAEKYAALCAIHDVVCEGAKPLSLWRGRRGSFKRTKSAMPFVMIRSQVGDLSDEDRTCIEVLLTEVERDVADSGRKDVPAGTRRAVPSGPQPSGDSDSSPGVPPAAPSRAVSDVAPAAIKTRRDRRREWIAHAMLLVRDYPQWPDRAGATAVGVDPSTLSRCREYRAAAAIARQRAGVQPRGFVKTDAETGKRDVEAYAPDPNDD